MSLKFISPDEPVNVDAIVMLVYGIPATGKTSLALGARNPLLVNFEGPKGYARATGSAPRIDVSTWDDVGEMRPEDFAAGDTIIVDTVGQALEALAAHLIYTSRKNGHVDSGLNQAGWGALKSTFVGWTKRLVGMGKDVVLLAHATETRPGDDTIVMRPEGLGKSIDQIFKFTDVMGYLSIGDTDDARVLTCAPTRSSYGKNPAGWKALPVSNPPGDFIARLIEAAKDAMSRTGTAAQVNTAPLQEPEPAPEPEAPEAEPAPEPEAPEADEAPPFGMSEPEPEPEPSELDNFNRELAACLDNNDRAGANSVWQRAKDAGYKYNPVGRNFKDK